jgi:hypothetical protein
MNTKLVKALSIKVYGAQCDNRLLVYLKAIDASALQVVDDGRISIRAFFKRVGDGSDDKEDSQKWVQVESESSPCPTGFLSLQSLVKAVNEGSFVEVRYRSINRNEYGLVCEGRILCALSE